MKNIQSERGQALIIFALAAIGLFGIVGLAIDGSAKFSDRRHAQNAADTAALAAALAKANALDAGLSNSPAECPPTSGLPSDVCAAVITAALNLADENGYDNSASKQVDVYSPPISGYYTGDPTYVQVIIDSDVNTTFSRVVGIDQTHNLVEAVALTKEGGPLFNGASIVSLNPSPNCGSGSFNVGGNGTINLSGGGFFVNSDESCGYSQTSCSVTLVMNGGAGISSAGSTDNINQACGTPALESTGQSQVVVPDEVYMPDEPIECSQTAATPTNLGSDKWRIYPGYYTDFPQGGLIGNNKKIYLAPGVYCVNSDLHWSGATFDLLDGSSGVTIYITEGHDFSISINSPITLNASNSGEYAGYLIILGGNMGSIENCTINGGGYLVVNGTIFAPYCNITVNGDSGTSSTFNAQVIGYDIKLNGNSTITFNYDPGNNAENKRKIGLMK
ncbi:MAG: pilus assembly protein TadG-related protein [Chloroflexota bacterium]|nr:pilus assembly protein TadG-related protein [Chloroflexota bacterium]